MGRKDDSSKCHNNHASHRQGVDRCKKINVPRDKNAASDEHINYFETGANGVKDTLKSCIHSNVKSAHCNAALETETRDLAKCYGHDICQVESVKNVGGKSEHLHAEASHSYPSCSSLHTVIIDCTSMAFIDSAGVATLAEVSFLFFFFFSLSFCLV